ncbi:hypothetical protein E6O75_ATG06329 [Venturia nashicola]|uniref:Uncharacterized protein n=1 Tax=Venturia nashicola TaxID=86259 RepID=A0A4Z1NXI7_9PEZI|nr:hypothetical protein E6O75_ATG06329 [Venturia nashicola]
MWAAQRIDAGVELYTKSLHHAKVGVLKGRTSVMPVLGSPLSIRCQLSLMESSSDDQEEDFNPIPWYGGGQVGCTLQFWKHSLGPVWKSGPWADDGQLLQVLLPYQTPQEPCPVLRFLEANDAQLKRSKSCVMI